jgi:ATPase subunit of ABC transporter with duplicated ATPase domains
VIVDTLKKSLLVPEIDQEKLNQNGTNGEIIDLLNDYADKSDNQLSVIKDSIDEYQRIAIEMYDNFINTDWYKEYVKEQSDIETNKKELAEEGIDYSALDDLMNKRKDLKNQLDEINEKKKQISEKKKSIDDELSQLKNTIDEISVERRKYASTLTTSDDNVKIVVHPMLSEESFISFMKTTLNKDNQSISDDLESYSKTLFPENTGKTTPLQRIDEFRTLIKSIREGNEEKSLSAVFRRTVAQLDDDNYYKLLLFYPDDKIELQYKPEGAKSKFSPLSSASAGQKAAAILTVILAQGEEPILLDQPEDDLDNKLVYELVVQRMKTFKEQKQIIVVTHNANIPVNGDAEYITSMDSQSLKVQIKCEGTLDDTDIRKEICDVMEGTEYAFEMRAKKYHLKLKK